MKIEKKKIKDLTPAFYNPRRSTPDQEKNLAESLKKFGVVEPIVWNKQTKNVVGGHFRLRELEKLGFKEVECVIVDLSLDDEKELNIRLNANTGEWDLNSLGEHFDLDLIQDWGFDMPEEFKEEEPLEAVEDDFESEPIEQIKTDIKHGDIIQIGPHRLMCGDSTELADVERLMDGAKADMVFTDPPYGVSYADKNKFLNLQDKGNHNQDEIANDHMTLEETQEFIFKAFSRLKESLAERSSYYITAPQGVDLLMMMMMMQKAGLTLRHCLIWVKNNHVLGRCDYNYKHEPILFGWNKVHDFYGEGACKFSTWEIPKPLRNDLHPTMKPVALIENACLNSTKKGMNVLDLFIGSGSTMVACHQLKRVCYGMELEPKYCQVIVDRMKKLDPDIKISKV